MIKKTISIFRIIKLFNILLVYLLIGNTNLYAQKERNYINIQKVSIADLDLIHYIEQYIDKETKLDSIFSKIGYVSLIIKNSKINNSKIKFSCYYNKCYESYDSITKNSDYPLFYTYIKGRIVTIKQSTFNTIFNYEINNHSINSFKKRLSSFIPPVEKIKFPGEKKGKYYRTPIIVIHGGQTYCKFEDGTSTVETSSY